MSPSIGPSHQTATPKPEENRGLEDPRTIHPSPEGIFPGPGETSSSESSSEIEATSQGGDRESGDVDRGIVDPRNDTIGPDI